MKALLHSLILLLVINAVASSQAVTPYSTCPDVNIAIARAGTNADVTNPYFLYNVNQATGAMTLVPGGPFKDPASPALNLQLNAAGINKKDGFIYALVYDGSVTTARFIRADAAYGVTSFGNIPSPSSALGTVGVVNSAAGDMDTSGNYFFNGITVVPSATPTLDKFFLGKISNVAALTAGGPAAVTYYEIDVSSATCGNYVSSLTSDPNNSGLKDFSFNAKTQSFFAYVTYKPTGAANYSGQVVEIKPIPGSSPLKYQLVCNPVVNSHTAEVSGTIIDKFGKFTVLFTDGSFGEANRNGLGMYDGTFTQITAATGLPNPERADMASCGLNSIPVNIPFGTCPDVNIAVARAGTNADVTNPYFLYNVNQTTGAMTLVPGGPFKDPASPAQNLQINAVGVNRKDGLIYGLVYDGTVTTARFVRSDAAYNVTSFGNIPSPSSTLGTVGIVNSAAGDMDTSGNYFFTGVTVNIAPPMMDKFFLGKISNVAALTTGPAAVTYYEVDLSNANCSNYVSTLTSDPNNSGLKDMSYNAATQTFFAYVTYKLPAAANFSGQLVEIQPIPGSVPLKYRLVCNPVVNTHAAEVSGTLIDKTGKFTVLFTDGSFGELNRTGGVYNGTYTQITAATGLPNPLRGDMASCGQNTATNIPNVPFTNCPDANIAAARAGTNADVTNPYFLYNVNQATGAMTLIPGGPFKDPANPSQNLQLNAIGLNRKDGFIYGLVLDGTVTTARFVRADAAYNVASFGNIPSPSSTLGTIGIVNSAAGDMDTSGNYFFTGLTVNPFPSLSLDKFFLGKISNVASLTTGPPAVTYYEVDLSGANCSNYVSTLSSDPNNSGLKDFSYNAATKTFFAYVTYKLPAAANFSGQVVELQPIPGSVPLKYRLVCNAVVNTHTAEVAGTIIDKTGKFTVLFTDGSFGEANRTGGVYNGTYTQISAATGLPNPLRGDMASCGQGTSGTPNTPFTTCPNVNISVARAGTNSDVTNPYFMYNVNQLTGAMTLVPGGPFKDPADPAQNLQLNAIGVNSKDGFIYGLVLNGTVTTARFVRADAAYNVANFGNIPSPSSTFGTIGIVNSAAGDMDTSGNYYFTGITINLFPPFLDKFYLGKISNVASLTTGPAVVTYSEVDLSAANCSNYVSTFTSDPNNSGLKDFSFNPVTKTFFAYVTYKLTGAANFSGQVVELQPIPGSVPLKYRLVCNPIVNTHNAEVAGTIIDRTGKFTVLFTDGSFGEANRTGGVYNGTYTQITAATGLPNPLRGDMATCGSSPSNIPLPVKLSSFTFTQKACTNAFTWVVESEVNFNHYELEQSFNGIDFTTLKTVASNHNTSTGTYKLTLASPGRQAYYRLKMVDDNDVYAYSKILSVNNACNEALFGFGISPNPVVSSLNLNLYGIKSTTQVEIAIYNNYGSIVKKITKTLPLGSSILTINVDNLPAGAYYINAIDANTSSSFQAKFVK